MITNFIIANSFFKMGNKNPISKQSNAQNSLEMRRNLNWNLIEKLQHRQILKSKRTELIIERHHYKTELFECFDEESKLFDWRNKNPNHQYIVSVLSTHHEVTQQPLQDLSDCGRYTGICPGKEKQLAVFVVTERILRIGQIPQFLAKSNQEISTSQKFDPFQDLKLSRMESKRIFKDWIRGIQILCYKFGYFMISKEHLGITAHKRGNVWMNQNYALNCLELNKRVNVTTAEQKFKYQKETITKVLSYIRDIKWFEQIASQVRNSDLQTFQQILQSVVQEKGRKQSRKKSTNHHTRNNSAQQLLPSNRQPTSSNLIVKPNSSSKNLNKAKELSYEQEYAFESNHRKNLVNSSNNDSHVPMMDLVELKRANTNQNNEKWMNIQEEVCLNSIHKITNKDTAPTLELGHSYSVHSINNRNNYSIMNNQNASFLDRNNSNNNISLEHLYKSHNNSNQMLMNRKGPASNLYRFGHMPSPSRKQSRAVQQQQKFFFHNVSTPDALMFRSLQEEENKTKNNRSPRRDRYPRHHNMSMDHSSIVGPYRKDKIYTNFKKENIALVDSMVMVQEQNEDYESQFNRQNSNVVLEESIILRGRHEENLQLHHSRFRH